MSRTPTKFEVQWVDLRSEQPVDGRRFDFDARLARLTVTLALDRRDDSMDPMCGWFHSTGVEYAAPAIGSQVDLQKLLLQQFAYLPLRWKTVLALGARYESSAGPGEVPLATDRLPTGGANTVRGYPDDWLGIRDVCNDSPGSMEYGKRRGRLPCRVILDDLVGKLGEILAAIEYDDQPEEIAETSTSLRPAHSIAWSFSKTGRQR